MFLMMMVMVMQFDKIHKVDDDDYDDDEVIGDTLLHPLHHGP